MGQKALSAVGVKSRDTAVTCSAHFILIVLHLSNWQESE